jgi:hypothetical protein
LPEDVASALQHVTETDGEGDEVEDPGFGDQGVRLTTRESMDSARTLSNLSTDLDSDPDDDHRNIDPSAYGSKHKAFEVALKTKTKHLLSLVKMDGILTPSHGRRA